MSLRAGGETELAASIANSHQLDPTRLPRRAVNEVTASGERAVPPPSGAS
ncbi:MAG: hypothetical protein ABSB34_00345 [Candidatus Limnocylindrales bacterium]